MRNRLQIRIWAPLVAAALLAAWTPLTAAEPGGATPEEVFDRFRAATEARDWEEMAACLTPEALAEMNASMVMMGGMIVAFAAMGEDMGEEMAEGMGAEESAAPEVDAAALQAQFEALLASHGIDESTMDALEAEGDDTETPEAFHSPAFFADIMGFIDSLPGDDSGGMTPPEGELENLVIDGDTATASVDGNEGGFVRVDGRWYVDTSHDAGEESEVEMEMEEEAAE